VVLLDSDTLWTEGTLEELVKPFADPQVGGVTTAQRILEHRRSVITRWADWLENSRAKYSMPAQSVLGQVGCLPGRTIAFRRHILDRAMPAFLSERFLGVFLEVSDDRTLTNLTLKQGYRTVYQSTSLVYTDAPLEWRKLAKQQLRWARGSQYNTLRMLPWMARHAPVLGLFFAADIALPFLLLGAVIGGTYRIFSGQGTNYYVSFLKHYGAAHGLFVVAGLTVAASALSMGVRQFRHLRERPFDILWMPVFVLISSLFLMPIRLLGFFRMAHRGSWGTRDNAYSAGTQDAAEGADGADGAHEPAGGTLATAQRVVAPARTDRRMNVEAALPYLLGVSVVLAEVLYRG
jgi:hyaluronan synthase